MKDASVTVFDYSFQLGKVLFILILTVQQFGNLEPSFYFPEGGTSICFWFLLPKLILAKIEEHMHKKKKASGE